MEKCDCIIRKSRCILNPKGGGEVMNSEAQKRAVKKYDKENTKGLYLKLNLRTDGDILSQLERMASEEGGKQGYIKALIRQDIAQNGK